MTFTSENNTRFKTMGLKLCALAGVGMLAVTGLSACSDDSDTDSDNSASSKKASNFDGDMTLDDAYAVYDTANKEGDTDEWCLMQTVNIVLEDYDHSNIHYLIENAKHIDSDFVADTARETCAHAILVADKSNQQTGEAYASMKYSLLANDINNIDYIKDNAKKVYPDANVDLAFDELDKDKDEIFEHVDKGAFEQAKKLYFMGATPAGLEEAIRSDDVEHRKFLPYLVSPDQYREILDDVGVDMADFAAFIINSKIDENLSAAVDEDKSRQHYLDGNAPKDFYHSEPPAEWVDRLVDEFKFTESEALDGARYALNYVKNEERRQPVLLVPYEFSEYVEGPDHEPVTYSFGNGEKAEITEKVYNKAENVNDLRDWKEGSLPVGVTNREAKKYSQEEIDQWREDGTPLK